MAALSWESVSAGGGHRVAGASRPAAFTVNTPELGRKRVFNIVLVVFTLALLNRRREGDILMANMARARYWLAV